MFIFLFVSMENPKSSVHTKVCVFTHCTGVINHKVCFFILRCNVAYFFQNTGKFFTVTGIHLTTKCGYTISKRSAKFFRLFFNIFLGFFHEFILSFCFVLIHSNTPFKCIFSVYFDVFGITKKMFAKNTR